MDKVIDYINNTFKDNKSALVQLEYLLELSNYLNEIKDITEDDIIFLINNTSLSVVLNIIYNASGNDKDLIIKAYFNNPILMNIIDTYLKINNIDISKWLNISGNYTLSFDEAKKLITAYQQGDIEARNIIIECNMGLIEYIAHKLYRSSYKCDFDDLVQEGVFGLIEALDNYDVTVDSKLSTYAFYWIRQKMSRYIHRTGNLIEIPFYSIENMQKVEKAKGRFFVKYQKEPSNEEIYQFLLDENIKKSGANDDVWTIEYIEHLDKISVIQPLSLNGLLYKDDGEGDEFLSIIGDDDDIRTLENSAISNVYSSRVFKIAKAFLNEKEYQILCMRMGVYGKVYTLVEIGEMYGVSRERIRQLEARAIKKLQSPIVTKYFEETDVPNKFYFYNKK